MRLAAVGTVGKSRPFQLQTLWLWTEINVFLVGSNVCNTLMGVIRIDGMVGARTELEDDLFF